MENGTKPFSTLQWLYETLLMKTKKGFPVFGIGSLISTSNTTFSCSNLRGLDRGLGVEPQPDILRR